ncbi:type IV pilus modification PilV family protein [Thiovibrio frasassiensis]|uniref:Prepilin-type N-terminal cleavage/methylation domain-containing protein n=1 Tax=Thiovibrio frasassiensis TaxID=2984131 RepID=A0A9X4MIZ4_9BACT|nr:prepilin-type N-terminal cleavage/methylation domain-containing protein [Thiovibrio frasassiensis]MDG4475729.1 prepilin-type N-terminal cleavage/methylation domain-containing protein [Thiovibrio frasassiensis]
MRNGERGFTIIEVLIAMLVLATGILGAAVLQITSIRGNSSAFEMNEAGALDAASLESLLAESYAAGGLTSTQLSTMMGVPMGTLVDMDGDGQAGLNDNTVATADYNVAQGRYTLFVNVWSYTPPAPAVPNVRHRIRAIMQWQGILGIRRQIVLNSVRGTKVP